MKFLEKKWKNKSYCFYFEKTKKALWIHYEGQTYLWEKPAPKVEKARDSKKQDLIQAHLPGRIQKIFVKKSQSVKKGELLLTLSAMKIEYSFKAEGEAQVEEIFCSEGQSVHLKQNLIKIKYKDLC